MAEFGFDYKPWNFGGGQGGGGGGGGQGGGGGGGGGRGNNQNGGNYRGNGRGDNMNWNNGRNDGANRFRGGGGGMRRDDLLPDKNGQRMSNMLGAPEARDMFGMRQGGPQTTIGTGGAMPDGGRGGAGALGVGASPMGGVGGGGPRPMTVPGVGGPMPIPGGGSMPARGGGGGQGGAPNIFGSNGQINMDALAKLMGPSAMGENMPGSNYTAPGTGMALSAGGGGDGGTLTPEQQQAKARLYAMNYAGQGGTDTMQQMAMANALAGKNGPSFGRGITNSDDFRASVAADRNAADLAHKQNLFAQGKGNPYATDFDYAKLAGMKPREAYRSMQPSPPPKMPRR